MEFQCIAKYAHLARFFSLLRVQGVNVASWSMSRDPGAYLCFDDGSAIDQRLFSAFLIDAAQHFAPELQPFATYEPDYVGKKPWRVLASWLLKDQKAALRAAEQSVVSRHACEQLSRDAPRQVAK